MRKRVKDQLLKIDETFTPVSFSYVDQAESREVEVFTLEELQYPDLAASSKPESEEDDQEATRESKEEVAESSLESGEHRVIQDNMKGITYEGLFARHLKDSKSLTIEDPYIRSNHQIRNLFEFLEMFYKMTPEGEENKVHLVTLKGDPYKNKFQEEDLNEIVNNFDTSRVKFSYTFSEKPMHARSIQTDTGWNIILDRGLDIFQRINESGRYNLARKLQEERLSKKFYITYLKI